MTHVSVDASTLIPDNTKSWDSRGLGHHVGLKSDWEEALSSNQLPSGDLQRHQVLLSTGALHRPRWAGAGPAGGPTFLWTPSCIDRRRPSSRCWSSGGCAVCGVQACCSWGGRRRAGKEEPQHQALGFWLSEVSLLNYTILQHHYPKYISKNKNNVKFRFCVLILMYEYTILHSYIRPFTKSEGTAEFILLWNK